MACSLLSFPLCCLQVLAGYGKQHFLFAIQVQKGKCRMAENHYFSLNTGPLVNLSSHINVTSVLSIY